MFPTMLVKLFHHTIATKQAETVVVPRRTRGLPRQRVANRGRFAHVRRRFPQTLIRPE